MGHFGPLVQTLTQFLLLHSELEYISPAHFEIPTLNEKYFHFPFASSFTGLRTAAVCVAAESAAEQSRPTRNLENLHTQRPH